MTTPSNAPDSNAPEPDPQERRPGDPGQPSPAAPPPGSKGYRKSSDPLPRGIPLADGTRSGGPRRPLSYGPGGAVKPTASEASQHTAGAPSRPTQPTPNPHAKTEQSDIFATPKVPPRDTPPPPAAATTAASPPPSPPDDEHDAPVPPAAPPSLPSSQTGPAMPGDYRRLLLLVTLVISLAAHGLLAWELYDQPLGEIDPQLIHQPRQRDVVRIQRAPANLVLPDRVVERSINQPTREDAAPPSPLPDLSIAMLQASPQANPAPAPPQDIKPDPQPFKEARPTAEPPPPGSVDLPAQITRQMSLNIPLSTRYVAPDAGLQANRGDLNAGNSGRDEALALLSQDTGLPGGSGNSRGGGGSGSATGNQTANLPAPAMPAPKLTDRADITERRPLPLDLLPRDIDLSRITDDAASNLAIPEHLDNDFDYAVTRYIPKGGWGVSEEDERGYFRVDITAKRSLRKLQTMPKDLVILIDTSESVPQHWIDHTLRGVRDSLASLNPEDRFNIVYFNDSPAILGADGILPVNDETLAQARAFLSEARSGGMTDVNQALSRLLVRDVAMDRSYEIILISDGRPTRGVMDTRELLNLVTRDNDLAASIYCIGVGRAQNRTLLEFLAYRNKGYCVFVDDPFQASIAVRDLVSRLRYPILKDVKLTVLGLNSEEVFPADLPTIHQGETFSIFGRFDNPGRPFTMRLMGHNGHNRYDFTFTRDLAQAPIGKEEISRDWGFWKLHHLYNLMLRQGDSRELRQAIEYLRRKYKLRTLYQ